ncbi:transcriptional repressor [Methylobacterium oryzae]|uniref:Transcriptional repressor n=2 Tax=Methylobacterium oryzae TaxID=334852 RepID=A0ABU7TTW3_9HYPH
MALSEQHHALRHAEPAHRLRGVGAPTADGVARRLRAAGIRPTRQRVAICSLLFGGGDRHVTAEVLFEEAQRIKIPISLATIYNCLHTFAKRRLIRELFVDPTTTYYDTNTSDHCHFVSQVDGSIMDVPAAGIQLGPIEGVPEGLHVVDVQVVVRLRPKVDGRSISPAEDLSGVSTTPPYPATPV